jgi:hypothetical protein
MATEAKEKDSFSPTKTYQLMELVGGTSPMANKGPDNTVFSFPIVALLEVLLILGTTLLVFVFSLLRNAPLEDIANPNVTTNPAKAPWYFVGLQELLEHMHPIVAGVLIPSLLVLFLIVIPYRQRPAERGALVHVGTRLAYFLAECPLRLDRDAAAGSRRQCFQLARELARGHTRHCEPNALARVNSRRRGRAAGGGPISLAADPSRSNALSFYGDDGLGGRLYRLRLSISRARIQVVFALADARWLQSLG